MIYPHFENVITPPVILCFFWLARSKHMNKLKKKKQSENVRDKHCNIEENNKKVKVKWKILLKNGLISLIQTALLLAYDLIW